MNYLSNMSPSLSPIPCDSGDVQIWSGIVKYLFPPFRHLILISILVRGKERRGERVGGRGGKWQWHQKAKGPAQKFSLTHLNSSFPNTVGFGYNIIIIIIFEQSYLSKTILVQLNLILIYND